MVRIYIFNSKISLMYTFKTYNGIKVTIETIKTRFQNLVFAVKSENNCLIPNQYPKANKPIV
ncbi:hypothetical protein JCM21142_104418 [Saccharicrinis fermentans DSM 9555 = JCM 21142]|uniref:Uncharacterized protein n=1 Tax=Saccharicrinis fermentans DSM 9555 = JCM 21142 TaxID=869213 RepID=W7YDY0_9BACT|nr:hypothetical protein JCM21142_104418 [Saccharicrinis fermentans DSM 9555 = JCM 21142]